MRTGTFFEINISKDGKHLLATDSTIRNTSEHEVVNQLRMLKEKFPPDDGHKFTVTCWKVSSPGLPQSIKDELPCHEKKKASTKIVESS